jgi:hypothetical protein
MTVSSVNVKIGDISSGGIKGTLKRGTVNPRDGWLRGGANSYCGTFGIERAGGVAGRERTINHVEVSLPTALGSLLVCRLFGRLFARE